jgi:HEPN domain-containing protein
MKTLTYFPIPEAEDAEWSGVGKVQQYVLFADAYWEAATQLREGFKENEMKPKQNAFPFLYLYSHSIELFLKAFILEKTGSHPRGHDIYSLSKELCKVIPGEGKRINIFAQVTCIQLGAYDKTGWIFKYPQDDSVLVSMEQAEHMLEETKKWIEEVRSDLGLTRETLPVLGPPMPQPKAQPDGGINSEAAAST